MCCCGEWAISAEINSFKRRYAAVQLMWYSTFGIIVCSLFECGKNTSRESSGFGTAFFNGGRGIPQTIVFPPTSRLKEERALLFYILDYIVIKIILIVIIISLDLSSHTGERNTITSSIVKDILWRRYNWNIIWAEPRRAHSGVSDAGCYQFAEKLSTGRGGISLDGILYETR